MAQSPARWASPEARRTKRITKKRVAQELPTHTFYLIVKASSELRLLVENALQPFGLTPMLYRAMSHIHAHPGSSSADLARLLNATPQLMNIQIRDLARARLIKRSRDDVNRRILRIVLSERGQALLEECEVVITDLEEHCLAVLTPSERDILRDSIVRLGRRFREIRTEQRAR